MHTLTILAEVAAASTLSGLLMAALSYFREVFKGRDDTVMPFLMAFFGAGAGLFYGLIIAFALHADAWVIIAATPLVSLVGLLTLYVVFRLAFIVLCRVAKLIFVLGRRTRARTLPDIGALRENFAAPPQQPQQLAFQFGQGDQAEPADGPTEPPQQDVRDRIGFELAVTVKAHLK